MTAVYAGSSLNIAATAASNGELGCFMSRESEHIKNIRHCVVQLSAQDVFGKIYACQNPYLWKIEVEDSPLASRGWIVQKRALAPRTLHFGLSQIYWGSPLLRVFLVVLENSRVG